MIAILFQKKVNINKGKRKARERKAHASCGNIRLSLRGKKDQIWNEPGQSSHFVHIKNLRLCTKTVITQSSHRIKKLKTNYCLFKNKKLTRRLLSYATHMLNIFSQNRKLLLQKYLKFIPHYLGYLTHILRLTASKGSSWKWFLSKLNHCLKMTR